MTDDATILDARHAALSGLFDDRTLLMAADGDMTEVLAAQRRARAGDHGWLLGRVVVGMDRVEELSTLAAADPAEGVAATPAGFVGGSGLTEAFDRLVELGVVEAAGTRA